MLAGLLLALHFVHDGLSHPPNEHPSRWSENLTAEGTFGCGLRTLLKSNSWNGQVLIG